VGRRGAAVPRAAGSLEPACAWGTLLVPLAASLACPEEQSPEATFSCLGGMSVTEIPAAPERSAGGTTEDKVFLVLPGHPQRF